MCFQCSFANGEESEAARKFWETEVRAERGNGKRASRYVSGIKNRSKCTWKREGGQKGWRTLKDKEDRDVSLFTYQIVDFTTALILAQPVKSYIFHSYISIKNFT